MRRLAPALLGLCLVLALAAAPSAAPSAPSRAASTRLTVLAAASLTNVLPAIAPTPRYSFGGSDQLAAQIAQGAPADVYAAASPKFPAQLFAQRLVLKPVPFTTNRLVVVVPRANPARIRTVGDLARAGVKVVAGDATVPIGAYTRQVLTRLNLTQVLGNVVSEETDVRGILAKVALGEADAGFVYVTDARVAGSRVRTIAIPKRGQPSVRYEVAVVRASAHRAAAARFVRELLSPRGQRILARAGFGR